MPGAESLPLSNRPLWAALSRMRIEEVGRNFEAELIEETGWSSEFAVRAVDEYRRFLFLLALSTAELTPSKAVDSVWHLHLTFDRHYRDALCGRILGRECRHLPGTGAPEEEARYRAQYEATLRLYEDVFAAAPPEDIWPRRRPVAPEKDDFAAAAARGRRILLWLALSPATFAAGFGVSALGFGQAGAALFLVSVLMFVQAFRVGATPRKRRDGEADVDFDGGDGASCGGAGGCGGSCGGSCGGGCGGCGG